MLCYHGGDLHLIGFSSTNWVTEKDERESTLATYSYSKAEQFHDVLRSNHVVLFMIDQSTLSVQQ